MRLTLWYTGVLALVIVVLCVVAYFIFWRSAVRRTDANLVELSDSFLVTLRAELEDQTGPDVFRTAAQAAIDEHHFRDTVYAIVDQTGKVIISSQETPSADAPMKAARRQILSSASFQKFLASSMQSDRLFGHIAVTEAGYRAFAQRFLAKGSSYTLIILQSLHPQKEVVEEAEGTPTKRLRLSPPQELLLSPRRKRSESESGSDTTSPASSRPTSPISPEARAKSPIFQLPDLENRILVVKS